jgi:hypothetical protein
MILEFELEDDVFNPRYSAPSPAQDVDQLSGVSSPGSSESTSSTIISGTIVSINPAPQSSDFVATMSSSICSSSPPKSTRTSMPMSSLMSEGDDSWTPSAEDILESTTNNARPLPALERVRKLNQGVEPFSAADPGVDALSADSLGSVSSAHTRRGKQRRKNGAVGMMDAFAVMSQVVHS